MALWSSRIPSRTATLLIVAVAHGLVPWMIWREAGPRADDIETIAAVMFFLPEPSGAVSQPAAAATPSAKARSASVQHPRLVPTPQFTDSSTAITLPAIPGAATDWSIELSAAADATLKKEKQARDQLGVFMRKFVLEPDPRNPGQTGNRKFRWYEAGIHRLDTRSPIPVLHVNDHCVLVAFIVPACALGHIESHGDLFKNMVTVLDEHEATARPNDVP